MSSRTIYDCDSCKAADICPITFWVIVGHQAGPDGSEDRQEQVDVCHACAEKLLVQVMGQLDEKSGKATYKAITKRDVKG